jgi:hypothetical protein
LLDPSELDCLLETHFIGSDDIRRLATSVFVPAPGTALKN